MYAFSLPARFLLFYPDLGNPVRDDLESPGGFGFKLLALGPDNEFPDTLLGLGCGFNFLDNGNQFVGYIDTVICRNLIGIDNGLVAFVFHNDPAGVACVD